MSRIVRLAKLSVPRTARVLPRPRLFRTLDRSRRCRVLWIVAPAGAGKTALVASWLRERKLRQVWLQLDEGDADVASFFHYFAMGVAQQGATWGTLPLFSPEFLAAPEGFARLFFRAICARPSSPAVIVFDDYQEVRADSRLHPALCAGFHELPEGITALVLSRAEPPPVFAELYVNGSLDVLPADELAVREKEAFDIARLWGYSRRDRPTVRLVHARTEGWAAGLVLLLGRGPPTNGQQILGDGERALFEYFAQEVLESCDAETQQVLLETALLPRIDGTQAARLTGVKTAQEILKGSCGAAISSSGKARTTNSTASSGSFCRDARSRSSASRRAEIRQLSAKNARRGGRCGRRCFALFAGECMGRSSPPDSSPRSADASSRAGGACGALGACAS